ncbi:uncharacterized protein LOC144937500 [Lampetra fluviatilis]
MLRNSSTGPPPHHHPQHHHHHHHQQQHQLSAEEPHHLAAGARLQDCLSNVALYLVLFFACLFGLVALLLAVLRRLRNAVTPASAALPGAPMSDCAGSDCSTRSAVEMDDLAMVDFCSARGHVA